MQIDGWNPKDIGYDTGYNHRHSSSAGTFYKSNKYPAFKISFPLCASQPDRTLLSRLRWHQSCSFFIAWGFPALTGLSSLCAICLCALHLVYDFPDH